MIRQKHKNISSYNWSGIPIHAAVGLHESAMKLLERSKKDPGLVLDLGCGSGAFSKRLQDAGYRTISVDLSLDTFLLESESREMDLNSDFAHQLRDLDCDVIVALEVIEHLENPIHFLRELKKLMKKETLLIVSFPNINLYVTFLSFLRNGSFANWSPYLYWETGHQSILTPWLFEAHLKKTGLHLTEMLYCAPFAIANFGFVKRTIHSLLKFLICMLSPAKLRAGRDQEVALFLVTTNNPD